MGADGRGGDAGGPEVHPVNKKNMLGTHDPIQFYALQRAKKNQKTEKSAVDRSFFRRDMSLLLPPFYSAQPATQLLHHPSVSSTVLHIVAPLYCDRLMTVARPPGRQAVQGRAPRNCWCRNFSADPDRGCALVLSFNKALQTVQKVELDFKSSWPSPLQSRGTQAKKSPRSSGPFFFELICRIRLFPTPGPARLPGKHSRIGTTSFNIEDPEIKGRLIPVQVRVQSVMARARV